MQPRRRSADTAIAHLKTLVRECAELTESYPRLAELAGMELVVDPWIYPRLILTLSEAIDETGIPAELHLAAMSFALAVNRQGFVIGDWSGPEGTRPHLGALLPATTPMTASSSMPGRMGAGMSVKALTDLRRRVEPLSRAKSPLNVPPPRKTRFGSPLENGARTKGPASFLLEERRSLIGMLFTDRRHDSPLSDKNKEKAHFSRWIVTQIIAR
jgi:hypothetical protein